MPVPIEWNQPKAEVNRRKHGIAFDEAATVFNDPLARIFPDPDHSDVEAREIIVGHSIAERLLFVSFTETSEHHIRLISARKATRNEQKDYEESVES